LGLNRQTIGAMMLSRRATLLALALVPLARGSAAAVPVGQIIATRGQVYREFAGRREPASRGTLLNESDVVVTDAGAKAKLQLNDGTIVSVSENARLALMQYQSTSNNFTTRIWAEAGAMRFFFLRTLESSQFEVETETAVAGVRGTEWLMDVTTGNTGVALLNGTVAVRARAGGPEVLLQAPGQGTDIRAGQIPTVPVQWGAQRFATTLARASFDL
jgi:hypothetical protein